MPVINIAAGANVVISLRNGGKCCYARRYYGGYYRLGL